MAADQKSQDLGERKDQFEAGIVPAASASGDPEEQELRFVGEFPLRQPVKHDGKEYTVLSYNLFTLRPQDLRSAKRQADAKERSRDSGSLFTDDLVHSILFLKSAGLPAEFPLGLADYGAISALVAAFFASGLAPCVR